MAQPTQGLGEIILTLLEERASRRAPTPDIAPLRVAPDRWVTELLDTVQTAREEPLELQRRMLEQAPEARVERIRRQREAERTFGELRRSVEIRTGMPDRPREPKIPAGHTVLELDAPRERFREQLRRLEAELRSGQVYA